jgi:hypothetical protein
MSLKETFEKLHLSRNNKERDSQVAEYLGKIAEEAASLAKIWENVAESILATGTADAQGNLVWTRLVERPEWSIYSNNIPRSRLEIFFDRVAHILGKNGKAEMNFLICKIGIILQKKKLTRELIEDELKRIKELKLFDKNNQIKGDVSIQESVTLLQREAEALSLFAKEFKAKI